MPARSTVYDWIVDNVDGFADRYARARDLGLDEMADELLEIADDGRNDYIQTEDGLVFNKEHVLRSRLRVEARKWYLAKLAPKRYGDRIAHEHSGPDGDPIQLAIEQETLRAFLEAVACRRQSQNDS